MTVYYKDDIGIIAATSDYHSIVFWEGELWFTSGGKDYKIKLENVIEIVKE